MSQRKPSRSKIFFKKMATMLPAIRDRWTPLYFEHGRMEQEGYSIKFVYADGEVETIPVAQISCIMLGPGTTITHQAIVSCSKTHTPIVWVGEDSLYFYAAGVEVNEKCHTAAKQAELFADPEKHLSVCRKMFHSRYGEEAFSCTLDQLRGKEGYRVRELYGALSEEFNVPWTGRNSSGMIIPEAPTGVNFMLNVANKWLYSLCLSVITTMGYIPSLGFIHADGKIPFVYDIADLYKEKYTIRACFEVYGQTRQENLDYLKEILVERIVKDKLLRQIPLDLKEIIS
jgi:CRISP-associated protein Cas1